MAVMVDKLTGEKVPVTAFINADRLAKDVARINDAARGEMAFRLSAWRWLPAVTTIPFSIAYAL